MSNIWEITSRVQTTTALILIVILLLYIAFKLSLNEKKGSKNTRKAVS